MILATPVYDLTVARYLAAREVDFIGISLDLSRYARPMQLSAFVNQLKEWIEGPRLIGVLSKSVLIESYFNEFDGFYSPELIETSSEKIIFSDGLKQENSTVDFHYLVYPSTGAVRNKENAFIEVSLEENPSAYFDFAGIIINPGQESQTGMCDFDALDSWFDHFDAAFRSQP